MLDRVLRNGRIIDGTGAEGRVGDVGMKGGRIVAVGEVTERGREELDCEGLLITPGWVDLHTHYDGQATWDPYLSPSGWHGVTTAILGNCGVGFAPCRVDDRDWLVQVMEGVEDIPGSALHEGIRWDWETFPEYIDALARLPFALDVGTQVPHAAVRGYVMGQRASEREAPTTAQIEEMSRLVEEGLRAGALGFTTSRTPLHKTAEGVPVAGTYSPVEELLGLAGALKRAGHGVFEIAPDHMMATQEFPWLERIARETGRNVVFNLSQTDQHPTLWREGLALLERAAAEGVPIFGQCAGRAIGILMTWRGTAHPFVRSPSFQALAQRPWPEQLAALRDRALRGKLVSERPGDLTPFEAFVTQTFAKMFPMGTANYEPSPDQSLAAMAQRAGRAPLEIAYDLMMERDGEGMLYFPLFNYSDGHLDLLHELHRHPRTVMGLADGGAHCGAICDGGMPTFMLAYWARDRARGRLPLEHVVKRQTRDTAAFYGLHDRGVIAPGYKADLNVIDFERLALQAPKLAFDLPAGGRRLTQDAVGYRATFVSGRKVAEDGRPTGELPGAVLRGPTAAPRA